MNNNLKTWKTIDLIGQISMAVLPLFFYMMNTYYTRALFSILFTVGGWQTLSFLIHLTNRDAPWIVSGRKFYTILYILVVCTGLFALVSNDFSIVFLFGMLIAGPVMAVIYFIVSLKEWQKLDSISQPDNLT